VTSLLADNDTATAQAIRQTYVWATSVMFEVRKQRSEAKQAVKVPITTGDGHGGAAGRADAAVEADLKAALACRRSRKVRRAGERSSWRAMRPPPA